MPYLMGSPGQSPAVFWPWPPTGWGQRERGSPVYNTKQKQIIQHKAKIDTIQHKVKIGSTTQSKNRQYNTKQKQTIQQTVPQTSKSAELKYTVYRKQMSDNTKQKSTAQSKNKRQF